MSLDNLDDLFASAEDDGLTDDTMDLVVANLNGPTMTGAVGVALDKLAATDITLAHRSVLSIDHDSILGYVAEIYARNDGVGLDCNGLSRIHWVD